MPLILDAAPGWIRAVLGTRIVTGADCLPFLKTGDARCHCHCPCGESVQAAPEMAVLRSHGYHAEMTKRQYFGTFEL